MRILYFGHRGWISTYFIPILNENGHEVIKAEGRADDENYVRNIIDLHNPDRVVSFIGRTHGIGINSIDYLEQEGKLLENIRDNLYAPLILAMACKEKGIHYTYIGTGCIFNNTNEQTAYTEDDEPNFFGSSYSVVKGFTDRLMKKFDNVLNVRIRMPITPDLETRNFITKIVGYSNICSIPNSMSVLPTLLPALENMLNLKRTGTINLVNHGLISHNEILEMYRDIVDPTKTWVNFTLEEQDKILLSKRSNNQLSTVLLSEWYPEVPPIHDAVRECMIKITALKKAEGL